MAHIHSTCVILTVTAAIILPCYHVTSFTLPYHPASCKPSPTITTTTTLPVLQRRQRVLPPPSSLYYSESEKDATTVESIDGRVQGRNSEAARLKVRLTQLKEDTKTAQNRADAYDRRVDLLRKQLIDMGEELEEEDRKVQGGSDEEDEEGVNGGYDEDEDEDDVDQEKLTLMDRVRYLTSALEQQRDEFDKKTMQDSMTAAKRRRLLKDEIDDLREQMTKAEQSAQETLSREKTSLIDQLRQLTTTMQEQKEAFTKKLTITEKKSSKKQAELQSQINKLQKELSQATRSSNEFKQITADLKGKRSELEWRLRKTLESAKNDIYELDRKLEESEALRQKEQEEAAVTLKETKEEYTNQIKMLKQAAEQQVAEMERDFAEELDHARNASKEEVAEVKRDRARAWEVKNDVIKRYRSALSIMRSHFSDVTSSAKSNLDLVKEEMKDKLADMADKNMQEKALLVQEKEEAVAELDDKIDRLTNANDVLSNHLKERKEYYESELLAVKADMTKRLVNEKTRSAMEKERILRETALIIAGKDRLIEEYETELTSFRRLARQALSVGKTRVASRFRRLVPRRRGRSQSRK